MNTFIMAYKTDIIDVYWIFITCLTYLLQVNADFLLHDCFPTFYYNIQRMSKLFM